MCTLHDFLSSKSRLIHTSTDTGLLSCSGKKLRVRLAYILFSTWRPFCYVLQSLMWGFFTVYMPFCYYFLHAGVFLLRFLLMGCLFTVYKRFCYVFLQAGAFLLRLSPYKGPFCYFFSLCGKQFLGLHPSPHPTKIFTVTHGHGYTPQSHLIFAEFGELGIVI